MTLRYCFWPATLLLGLLLFPLPLAAQVQSSTDGQGTIRIINPGDAGEGKKGAEVGEGVRPEEPVRARPTPVPRSRQSVLQERQKFFGQGGAAGPPPGAQNPLAPSPAAPPVPTPPGK
jgi:hypothetical protein